MKGGKNIHNSIKHENYANKVQNIINIGELYKYKWVEDTYINKIIAGMKNAEDPKKKNILLIVHGHSTTVSDTESNMV